MVCYFWLHVDLTCGVAVDGVCLIDVVVLVGGIACFWWCAVPDVVDFKLVAGCDVISAGVCLCFLWFDY